MRPKSAETSAPAWVKRKMLSMNSKTSLPSWSRKYSACARPVRATRARAGRLVHLAVDQGALGAFAAAGQVHIGLNHLVIEVISFARTLSDAGKHRIAAVGLGDVVDQLLHGDRLAHASAAEEADLAALGVGTQEIDDLDPGDQHFSRGRLLGEARRFAMD